MTQKFGPHVSLGVGFLGGITQFIFLWGFTQYQHLAWLYLAAASLALTNAAIWNSLHIHISRVMTQGTKSSSLATMEIVNQVLGVATPLLGG